MAIRCKCGQFLSKNGNEYDKICKKCTTEFVARSAAGQDWFSGSDGNDYIAVDNRLTLKPKEEKKMSFFNVNHKEAGNMFDPVPEGKYEALITKTEVKKSNSGNEMISVQLTIRDDVDQGSKKRKIFDNLVATEKAMFRFQQVSKAILLPDGADIPSIHAFASEILNCAVKVTVKHEENTYNGETRTQERVAFYDVSDKPRVKSGAAADPFANTGGGNSNPPIDISDDDLPF